MQSQVNGRGACGRGGFISIFSVFSVGLVDVIFRWPVRNVDAGCLLLRCWPAMFSALTFLLDETCQLSLGKEPASEFSLLSSRFFRLSDVSRSHLYVGRVDDTTLRLRSTCEDRIHATWLRGPQPREVVTQQQGIDLAFPTLLSIDLACPTLLRLPRA